MKSMKYYIIDNALFWKDSGGILLNCLLKDEANKVMQESHEGDCGDTYIGKLLLIRF